MANRYTRVIGKPNPELLALKHKRKLEREAARQTVRKQIYEGVGQIGAVEKNMFEALKARIGGEAETNEMFARRVLDILKRGTDRDVIRLLDVTAKYTVAPPARRVEVTRHDRGTLVLDVQGVDPATFADDFKKRLLSNGTDAPGARPAVVPDSNGTDDLPEHDE